MQRKSLHINHLIKIIMGKTANEILAERGGYACKPCAANKVKLGFTQNELNEAIFTYGSDVHSIIEDEVGEFIQELFSDLTHGSISAVEFALSIQGAVNRGRG